MLARLRGQHELVPLFEAATHADPASTAARQHLITALQWAGKHQRATDEIRRAVSEGLWLHQHQRPARYSQRISTPSLTLPSPSTPPLDDVAGTRLASQRGPSGLPPSPRRVSALHSDPRIREPIRACELEGTSRGDRACNPS